MAQNLLSLVTSFSQIDSVVWPLLYQVEKTFQKVNITW